jgi:hypothetical protein
LRYGRVVVAFSVLLFLGIVLGGMPNYRAGPGPERKSHTAIEMAEEALKKAQTAKALEEKGSEPRQITEKVSKDVQDTEAAVEDSATYKMEAATSAQRPEDVATRAENASL